MIVNWLEEQPYRCYFYPGRDCPGWHEGQPCDSICQRFDQKIPAEAKP